MLAIFIALMGRRSDAVVRVDVGELFPCIGYELFILEKKGILRVVIVGKALLLSLESTSYNSMLWDYLLCESLQFLFCVCHMCEARKIG